MVGHRRRRGRVRRGRSSRSARSGERGRAAAPACGRAPRRGRRGPCSCRARRRRRRCPSPGRSSGWRRCRLTVSIEWSERSEEIMIVCRCVIAPIRPTMRGSIAPLSRSRFWKLVGQRQVGPVDRGCGDVREHDRPGDRRHLASALQPVGLVEHLLDVPGRLVVAEDAGPQVPARPDQASQGGGGVADAAVADDGRLRHRRRRSAATRRNRGRAARRRRSCRLLIPRAVVGLEAGDRGQRPDSAAPEVVAPGGALEGGQVGGRDLVRSAPRPGRIRACGSVG